MIDFKSEVLKRKDKIIKDLQDIIKVPSELTTFDPNRVGAPFGPENKKVLDLMLDIAKRDGFITNNVDGYAGDITLGNQNDYVAILGHLDVVPAGNDWTYPPYEGKIVEGKMYGRGTMDDKGPTIASYYAMVILKELGIDLSKRVKLILGIDEESGWRCMNHYLSKNPELPVSGFVPDADFPLIYAEKGITRTIITAKLENSQIISIDGGFRDNMVPDYCEAVIDLDHFDENLFKSIVKDYSFDGKYTLNNEANEVKVLFKGESAHGSTPWQGKNAINHLFLTLELLGYDDPLISFVNTYLYDDLYGEKLGVNYYDEEMGDLTVNFGTIKLNDEGLYELNLNLRYPNGVDYEKDVFNKIEDIIKPLGFSLKVNHHQKLLYNDPNSNLVKTLMNVYKKHANDLEAKPLTIGGGTFARALPNTLAFGMAFPGKENLLHQPNEYVEIDDLLKACIIYTEALYELAK